VTQQEEARLRAQAEAPENDRSGQAGEGRSTSGTVAAARDATKSWKGKVAYDQQEYIRKLQSKVLEKRKKRERENAEKKLREDQRVARLARVRMTRTHALHLFNPRRSALRTCSTAKTRFKQICRHSDC
jgi:hypothetical protein